MTLLRTLRSALPTSLLLLAVCTWAGSVQAADEPAPAAETSPDMSIEELRIRLVPLSQPELANEAAAWLGYTEQRARAIADRRAAMLQASDAAADEMRASLTPLVEARRRAFDQFEVVLQAWEAKGGDADRLAEYRRYISAVRAGEIKSTDRSTAWAAAKKWLVARDGGIRIGLLLLALVLAMILLLFAAKLASSGVHRGLARSRNLSTLLQLFLVRATFWATVVVGLLTVLALFGVRLTPVLTLLGGLSFVAAFAMQSTLSNFAAGLMIMIYKPFDVGHVVTIGGVTGTVKEMSLVSTSLVSGDNQIIVVPNSNVWGSMITNINASATRRVDLLFGIGYGDDEDEAVAVLEDVVRSHPLVLADPAPVIRVHQLADSSVNIICRPWTRTENYWAVYWDVTRQAKARFDAAGITIPYPQRDVHIHTQAAQPGTSDPAVVSEVK